MMYKNRFYFIALFLIALSGNIFSQGLPPGWEFQATPSNHVIAIPLSANPNINGRPLDPGDWIGVFYTNDQGNLACGGATEWNGLQSAGIIAFGNDPFTPGKNGFNSGEPFTYKVFSWFYGCEFMAEVTCNDNLPSTCEQYAGNGLSGVVTLDAYGFFQPVWESPFNPMTFYIVSSQYNGQPLQHCDEIGIFDIDPTTGEEICVGVGILSEPLGGDIFLEMIASMDDGTLPGQANGFTPGNNFIFKFFSQSEGLLEEIDYSFPYSGYDEIFTPQGSSIVELSGQSVIYEEHIIPLQTGWTGVSSFLVPGNPAIEMVTSDISGQMDMINNLEEFYQPGNPLGNLSEWNYQSGYFIKVNENSALTIQGLPPASTSITLQTGWNLMPVLINETILIANLFGDNLSNVEMIKDAAGLNVFWPEKNVTTLQSLLPGKTYMVKVSQNFSVSFN
jgi:hypothetical protein